VPVTPFHFGVGLLGKGIAPRRISLSSFVASQVVIDLESAYYLFIAPEWPAHRWAHTLAVAVPVGVAVGVALWSSGPLLTSKGTRLPEVGLWPCVAGGLLGGATHPLLDAVMHRDVQPFMPFAAGNPFLGVIALGPLHLACIAAGVLGGALLALRSIVPPWRRKGRLPE
jgi:membrane-bound metal-dependent hydrolase YbcI (DUF457 family)